MNCKQGDWAIVVHSVAGNEGKIVRCVRLVGNELWVGPDGIAELSATWELDRHLRNFGGDLTNRCMDKQLRPIRDNDGEDEILRIAGRPVDQREPA